VSPGLAPCEAGRHAHLGSALRLSQPLSGFLAVPSFAALFHAATVRGILPSEVSPRPKSRTPLGAACFLVVIHLRADSMPRDPCHRRFQRRPRFHAVACLPRRLWALFSRSRENASRLPWGLTTELEPSRWLHPLRSLDPPTESVHAEPELPRAQRPILSWSFASLKPSPPTLGILEPARPREAEHALPPESVRTRPKGPRDPSSQVSQPQNKIAPGCARRRNSGPLRDRPAPPRGGAPTPLAS